MIKANELRVGNSVSIRGNHRIYKVLEVLQTGVRVKYWSCGETEIIGFNKLTPIPLTPELLESCGFQLDGFTTEDIYSISTNKGSFEVFIDKDGYFVNAWKGVKIQYLHQLQNLYFSLTGEELTIKELV